MLLFSVKSTMRTMSRYDPKGTFSADSKTSGPTADAPHPEFEPPAVSVSVTLPLPLLGRADEVFE